MLRAPRVVRAKGTIPVILVESSHLGEKGEIIQVKRGHARNHLFPKKMAVYETPVNRLLMREWTDQLDLSHREHDRKTASAQKRIENVLVTIRRHMEGKKQVVEDEYAVLQAAKEAEKTDAQGEEIVEPMDVIEIPKEELFDNEKFEQKATDGAMHAPVYKEDIAKHLWRQHFIEVELDRILLDAPLGTFGDHKVKITLPEGGGTADLAIEIKPR